MLLFILIIIIIIISLSSFHIYFFYIMFWQKFLKDITSTTLRQVVIVFNMCAFTLVIYSISLHYLTCFFPLISCVFSVNAQIP